MARRPAQRTDFGQRLFDARTGAGLSQQELAKLAGIAQSTLSELETSADGSSATVLLAAACGVSAEWLATGGAGSLAGPWPLGKIITPAEWKELPQDVRDDVLSAAAHYIERHRTKAASTSTLAQTNHDLEAGKYLTGKSDQASGRARKPR